MTDVLWTRSEIDAALGFRKSSKPELEITGVSIDSRTLNQGDLFVAIQGDRTDGHLYVGDALRKGAAAVVVARTYASQTQGEAGNIIVVDNPLNALNTLGRAARARSDAAIVAVTGSVGKTGTKEMLRTIFGASKPVHASDKSYNNQWGVPLSLARMPKVTAFGVFEIGMNHAGEITPLVQMVRPHGAIVTWVDAVHIEFFESVEEIADAKAEIFSGVERGGFAVLPANNAHFARLYNHASSKGIEVFSFGTDERAASRLVSYEETASGALVSFSVLGETHTVSLNVFGQHLAMNALAALTAAKLSGADMAEGAMALERFQAPEGRGVRHKFQTPDGPVLIIDEAYNANPASMRAALHVLGATDRAQYTRRIAILGDMLELGLNSEKFHAELATDIDLNAVDLVFCAGTFMKALYENLPRHKQGYNASSSDDLKHSILNEVRGGDAVMIKGSLGSRMLPLVQALITHFEVNADRLNIGKTA